MSIRFHRPILMLASCLLGAQFCHAEVRIRDITTIDESIPPDRNAPRRTSDSRCDPTASETRC